jgi:hypothetical protein
MTGKAKAKKIATAHGHQLREGIVADGKWIATCALCGRMALVKGLDMVGTVLTIDCDKRSLKMSGASAAIERALRAREECES